MRRTPRIVLLLLLSVPFHAAPSVAQSWTALAVPDSLLDAALVAGRANYENTWNALFVAELRAGRARPDSAARLAALERRIAGAEPRVLGSRIAADALALRSRWKPTERRVRIAAAVTESLATVARTARAWPVADSLFRSALASYRRLGEKRREAWVLGSLGVVALGAGREEHALEVYSEALTARRALGDPRLLGNTLNDLGQTFLRLERYDDAARHLAESAAVRERSGQLPGLGAALGNLGSAMVALGDRDSAERCFARSLALTAAAGDSGRILGTLINYGAMLMNRGEVERPLRLYDRAMRIARESEDLDRASVLEDNLGDLELRRGRFSAAIRHHQAAVAVRADDPPRLAVSLNGLGGAFTSMGDAERARPPLARALALADSLGDASLASLILTNLAFTAEVAGDLEGARALALRAAERAVVAGDSARALVAAHTAGEIELRAGEPVAAGRWIDRALAATPHADSEIRAGLLTHRALAWHLEGRLDDAEAADHRALAMAEETGASDVAARILVNLGDIAERRRDYPAAFARYGQALARIDAMRGAQAGEREAVKTLASRVYVHEAMIHLLGTLDPAMPDSGYAARAFDWAERARGRALLDLAAAAGGHAGPAATVSLAEAQRRLGAREALLEYSVGDSSTSLWVVRRDRWKLVRLPSRAVLRVQVQRWRHELGDPESAGAERALAHARALYRELIEPAEPWLAGAERLVISPDGPLALLPFEALPARDPSGDRVPKGAYLVERFAVRYVVSASSLAHASGSGPGLGIVAVGNPDFVAGRDSSAAASEGEARLEALPNTALEVASLRRLGRGRPIEVLEGADASAARVLALPGLATARLIHLATHGEVDEAEPDRSGLWFAPDSAGAGPSRLEAGQVMNLRLVADLVTLSACQTGLGRLERGEGVIGLPRAFLAAGARSVLVSLWNVNDRSTALLMDAFYRRMLAGGKDRAAALAAAKRDLMAASETRSPFYWAPFVLVGDSGAAAR